MKIAEALKQNEMLKLSEPSGSDLCDTPSEVEAHNRAKHHWFKAQGDFTNATSTRESWIDWIRVAGAVAIVVLHVTAREKVWRAGELNGFDWWTLVSYETVTRIAVPLFFMISGYLILGRCAAGDRVAYSVSRAGKTLVLALVWTLVYSSWEILRGRNSSLLSFVANAMLGTPYYHLWFLYAIATTYFIAPIIAPGLRTIDTRYSHWVGWLLPILASTDFMIASYRGVSFGGASCISLGIPFVALTAAGYLLLRPGPRIASGIAATIYIAGFIGSQIAYFYLYDPARIEVSGAVFYVFSPTVVLMSLAAYVGFSGSSRVQGAKLPTLIQRFANDSLAIYLLHPLVLDTLNYFRIYGRSPNALLGIAWMSAIVLGLTWSVVTLIRQVPLVRRIVLL